MSDTSNRVSSSPEQNAELTLEIVESAKDQDLPEVLCSADIPLCVPKTRYALVTIELARRSD